MRSKIIKILLFLFIGLECLALTNRERIEKDLRKLFLMMLVYEKELQLIKVSSLANQLPKVWNVTSLQSVNLFKMIYKFKLQK